MHLREISEPRKVVVVISDEFGNRVRFATVGVWKSSTQRNMMFYPVRKVTACVRDELVLFDINR